MASATTSLGERLLAQRDAKAQVHERTGVIHLGGGELHVRYGLIPYREDRTIGQRHTSVRDVAERELRAAADTLVAASRGCEAHIGEEVHELPPLGLELAAKLGLDAPENDRQVVFMLFPSDRAVMEEFVEHEAWTARAAKGIDDEQLGNSEAATS